MDKKMTIFARLQAWGRWDLVLGLLVFSWPITRFLKSNGDKSFASVELWLLFFGFCVIFGSVTFCFRRQKKIVLSVLLFFLCFFTFADFYTLLEQSLPTFMKFYWSYGGRVSFLWIALVAGLMWCVWRLPSFLKIAVPFLWIFVSVAWIEVLPSLLRRHKGLDTFDPFFSSLTLKHKPNIYFLMIDGYPGEKTLRNVVHTEGLAPLLRRKRFVVPQDTKSNYHFTQASLSSQFQMHYHQPDKDGLLGQGFDQFCHPAVGKNNFVRTLKKNGYKFVFAPSGRASEFSCKGFEDLCWSENHAIEVFDVFKQMTPLRVIPFTLGKYLELDNIKAFARQPPVTSPYFVFAHFFQIHNNVDTCRGRARQKDEEFFIHDQTSLRRFKSVLGRFDQKVLSLVRVIQEREPQAVILISSDHGAFIKLDPPPHNTR